LEEYMLYGAKGHRSALHYAASLGREEIVKVRKRRLFLNLALANPDPNPTRLW